MKIALTSDYFYPTTGGAEQSALELSKALLKKGHQVVVFTRGEGTKDYHEGLTIKRIFEGLNRYTFNSDVIFPRLVDRKESKRLTSQIKDEGFDILHSNNRDTAIFTALAGDRLDIPVLTHIRDFWPICPKRDMYKGAEICEEPKNCGRCMAKYYEKWMKLPFYYKFKKDTRYRREKIKELSDLFIYNSSYMKEKIALSPGRVVYNPIDVEKIKKIRGEGKESGKLLFIGNVTRRKGVHLIQKAVKGLDVTLHVIGDGHLSSKIEGKNIIKHGQLDYEKVLYHLSTAEVLLVPSLWPEPFGRVAVEGMASGTPVIVSDHGGLPEVVDEAGIVIKDQTVESWREKIKTILRDDSFRDELSEKGKERSKIFRPDKIADAVLSIYKEKV